jgi:hypothetical protein
MSSKYSLYLEYMKVNVSRKRRRKMMMKQKVRENLPRDTGSCPPACIYSRVVAPLLV